MFSPGCGLSSFYLQCLSQTEIFNSDEVQLISSSRHELCLYVVSKKVIAKLQVMSIFSYVIVYEFYSFASYLSL